MYADGDGQGYCAGTGQTFTAQFTVAGVAKVKVKVVKVDGRSAGHKTLQVTDNSYNGWHLDLTTVATGDPCTSQQKFGCDGVSQLLDSESTKNFAYAEGIGKKIVFGTELTGAPTAFQETADCANNQDFFPVPDTSGLGDALAPYVSASTALSLAKLERMKEGDDVRKTYKPLKGNIPDGYDLASCNHAPGNACTAPIDDFQHVLDIKQLS